MTERELELCRKALLYMATGLELALKQDMIKAASQKEAAEKDAAAMRELSNEIMDGVVT